MNIFHVDFEINTFLLVSWSTYKTLSALNYSNITFGLFIELLGINNKNYEENSLDIKNKIQALERVRNKLSVHLRK